ncbi:hypothetical protein ACJZTR_00415 [Neorickettsia risticii]
MSTVELCKPKYLFPILFITAIGLLCLIAVLATEIVFIRRVKMGIARLNKKVDGLCHTVENFCSDRAVESFYKKLDLYLTANISELPDELIKLRCGDDLRQTSWIQSGNDGSTVLYDVAGAAEKAPIYGGYVLTKQLKPEVSVSLKIKSPKNVGLQEFNHVLDVAECGETEGCDDAKQILVDSGISAAYSVRRHPSGSSQDTGVDVSGITTFDASLMEDSVRSADDNGSDFEECESDSQCLKKHDTVIELGDCNMNVNRSFLTASEGYSVGPGCELPDPYAEGHVSFLNSLEKASEDLMSPLDASLVYASAILSSFDTPLLSLSGANDSVKSKTSISTSITSLSVTGSGSLSAGEVLLP